MLPHIHDQHRNEAGHIAGLMQRNPMIGESAVVGIEVTDGPADSPHFPHADEIASPCFIRAETAFGRPSERGLRSGMGRSVGHEIVEIVLVQHHPIVFEPVSPFEFRVDRHLFLIDLPVFHEFMNSRREIIRLLDVPLVKFEMHGECPVRDAVKIMEII